MKRTAAANQSGAMIRRGLADPSETKSGGGDAWHGDAGALISSVMLRHCTALNRMGNDRRFSALAMNGPAMLGHGYAMNETHGRGKDGIAMAHGSETACGAAA